MDKLAKLMQDIGILWEKYRMMYLNGMLNTLGLALAATAIGCIIGLLCGILNTIPCAKNDPLPKRILLKILRVIIRIYVEVFRGTPMMLRRSFSRIRLGSGSFLAHGMVLRMPQSRPMTQPIAVAASARPSVLSIPFRYIMRYFSHKIPISCMSLANLSTG